MAVDVGPRLEFLQSIDKYLETFENRRIDLVLVFTAGEGKETDAIFLKDADHGKFLPGSAQIATAPKARNRQTC